jgi:hypothetical protein
MSKRSNEWRRASVLLDKQLSLQTELHGLLMSGDAFYNPVMEHSVHGGIIISRYLTI